METRRAGWEGEGRVAGVIVDEGEWWVGDWVGEGEGEGEGVGMDLAFWEASTIDLRIMWDVATEKKSTVTAKIETHPL